MNIKYIAAFVATVVAGSVAAQSTVTLYGVVDAGIRYDTNADGAGNKNIAMIPGGLSNSLLGLKGVEEWSPQFKVRFQLEHGFGLGEGRQDGALADQVLEGSNTQKYSSGATITRFFNRTAKLCGEGGWGSLCFGRQYSLLYDTITAYEPTNWVNTSPYGSSTLPLVSSAFFTDNRYVDNNIYYTGEIGPFTLRASYAPGGVPGTILAGSHQSLGVAYTDSRFHFGIAANRTAVNENWVQSDGQHLANYTNTAYKQDTFTAGGSFIVGPVKAMAGYARFLARQSYGSYHTYAFWGGLTYARTAALDLTAAYYRHQLNGNSVPGPFGTFADGKADVYVFIAAYKWSKRTTAYLEYDYAKTGFADGLQSSYFPLEHKAPGVVGMKNTRNGLTLGLRHLF